MVTSVHAEETVPAKTFSPEEMTSSYEKLLPLHRVKTPPGPYDWMAVNSEPGQTFAEYVASQPKVPDATRKYIYIALLGDFDEKSQKIVEETARFVEVYFGLPVKRAPAIALAAIPASARRVHPQTGDKQILTSTIIVDVLKPAVPKDAFCLIAFTASDLWPGAGWNFVFGQASLDDRVGVWSISRNGDPNAGPQAYQLCLLRTLKTGTHEIAHMFSLPHCVFYECNLNGSNHRVESDRRPLWLCPVCLRKLQWAVKFDVGERYQSLAEISASLGLANEAAFYRNSVDLLLDKSQGVLKKK